MSSHEIRKGTRCIAAIVAATGLFTVTAATAATYSQTVLTDQPVAYYRLEETSGATAVDSSASGAFSGAYNFNGLYPQMGQPGIDTNSVSMQGATPSSVTAGYYSALNPQGAFSFEVWARPTSTPNSGDYRCPIGNFGGWDTGGGSGSGWYVYQTADSTFAFITAPNGVWITSPYTVFNWYHLVGTYDGTNGSFYVNGVPMGTQAHAAFLANPGNPLGIGHRADGYGAWDGNLDEVAIYTHALTPAQVLAHYTVGTNSFRSPPVPAIIRRDPASVTNFAGHVVQFSVLADGTMPLAYQWYKGTSPLGGAVGTSLSFTCAVTDDGTSYKCVVTNNYGSDTSEVATLTVSTGLSIKLQPTSITRTEGATSKAAFLVVAEGMLPLSYQWYKGTSQIPGATNQTLWLSGVQMADDQSSYYARVNNPSTFIDSDPATLTVVARAVSVPVTGYARVVMADKPVAYYRLNEAAGSATAVDAAGSFDGTYNAGAGTFNFGVSPGIPHEADNAVSIASGAVVTIPYALELNPWGPFSVEGWFQPASTAADGGDYRTAFSSMYNIGGVGPTGWLLYQQGNNTWAWVPYGGNWANLFLPDTSEIIAANQWYHIGLTYDGTRFTVYVNGAAKASGTYSGFVQNGNLPNPSAGYNYTYNGSGPTVLGWRSDVDFHSFAGAMDEVAFYNYALSPQQIQNHFLNTERITIAQAGANVVLTWPVGVLQAGPAVSGVYTNVPGAISPYTNTISGSQKYLSPSAPVAQEPALIIHRPGFKRPGLSISFPLE